MHHTHIYICACVVRCLILCVYDDVCVCGATNTKKSIVGRTTLSSYSRPEDCQDQLKFNTRSKSTARSLTKEQNMLRAAAVVAFCHTLLVQQVYANGGADSAVIAGTEENFHSLISEKSFVLAEL